MIVFRVDGNERIGAGHVMRCLSIADAARDRGISCNFVLADNSFETVIEERGYPCRVLNTIFSDMDGELQLLICTLEQINFEFIIVDNGSEDSSGTIADSYAETDSRVRVIHRERGNIGSGRNTGLDAAKGRYIAFVDDDDTCTPDFLEFLYRLAEESKADIAICGASWSNVDEKCVMKAEQAMEILLWRKRYNVAFPTKMFRKELFEHNRFLETGKYDDIYLMPKMIAAAEIIAYHGLSKYHFERHENNISAWTQNHKLLDSETLGEYLNVYRERTEWLIKRFPESAEKWQYFNWSFMISMVERVTRLELKDCYMIRDELIKELHKDWINMYVR